MKVHKYDVDGTHYRICTGLMEGSLLVAFPDLHWSCEWSPGAPPPSAEWLGEHGLPSIDCGPVAAILRRVWPAVALRSPVRRRLVLGAPERSGADRSGMLKSGGVS